MKRMVFLLIILLTFNVFAQDVNTNIYTTFYRDTLTTTIDTVQLKFQSGFDYFTISVYSSGTDTINVYTKGEGDYGLWTQKALIDLSTAAVVSQIIATSTVKEYLIIEPSTMHLRLITPDASANAIFTINAKKGNYAINGTSPLTLPLPTGAATSAKQDSLISDFATAKATIQNVSSYLHPADTYPTTTSVRDTVTTGTDSVSFAVLQEWGSIAIRNVSTDGTILQISLSRTFAGSRLVYPQETGEFSFFDPAIYTKLYVKKYSGTNGYYDFTWEGY